MNGLNIPQKPRFGGAFEYVSQLRSRIYLVFCPPGLRRLLIAIADRVFLSNYAARALPPDRPPIVPRRSASGSRSSAAFSFSPVAIRMTRDGIADHVGGALLSLRATRHNSALPKRRERDIAVPGPSMKVITDRYVSTMPSTSHFQIAALRLAGKFSVRINELPIDGKFAAICQLLCSLASALSIQWERGARDAAIMSRPPNSN